MPLDHKRQRQLEIKEQKKRQEHDQKQEKLHQKFEKQVGTMNESKLSDEKERTRARKQ